MKLKKEINLCSSLAFCTNSSLLAVTFVDVYFS